MSKKPNIAALNAQDSADYWKRKAEKLQEENKKLLERIDGLEKVNEDLRHSLALTVKLHLPINKNLNK
jgi:uncharacterized protein with von Willebrand factor type A (vWA) domain